MFSGQIHNVHLFSRFHQGQVLTVCIIIYCQLFSKVVEIKHQTTKTLLQFQATYALKTQKTFGKNYFIFVQTFIKNTRQLTIKMKLSETFWINLIKKESQKMFFSWRQVKKQRKTLRRARRALREIRG